MPESPQSFTHETFIGAFTWRYGSKEMRQLWSEVHKRRLWRRLWVALAEAEHAAGLVSAEQVADLRTHADHIDIERAHAIEAEIHHDLMAEIRTYAEQCSIGGGIIHLGATSMDIEDNADALRLRESVDVLLVRLQALLGALVGQIERHADLVCMAYTHLQPAEPTTVGYRLAVYGQDLLRDLVQVRHLRAEIRGKGIKGAVGTAASYAELLRGTSLTPHDLELRVMDAVGLAAFPIATQTYPRRQDWEVLTALAGIGLSVYRMAFDLRILQSPPFGEWSEPFGAAQVGSSAMPFKRNPINAENIDSLARYLSTLPQVAWENAANNLLERTLDDSANRRIILPEAFLAADEILLRATRVIKGLKINADAIRRNVETYGVFAATERLLMEGARHGADRQAWHELIREHSLATWDRLREGGPNTLADALAGDARITALIPPPRVRELLRAETHIGDAPERARAMAHAIHAALEGADYGE